MKLTKTDKSFLIEKVLRETFKAKFDEWEKRIKEQVQAKIFADHPVFERLIKDKDCNRYLRITHPTVRVNGVVPRVPDYEHSYVTYEVSFRDVDEPYFMDYVRLEDKDYDVLCDQYTDAHSALTRMLNSYTSREKFLVDFPEYKDYLPTVEKAGLPAIVPSQIRGELSALGIPAK